MKTTDITQKEVRLYKVTVNAHAITYKVFYMDGTIMLFTGDTVPDNVIEFIQSSERVVNSISSAVCEYTLTNLRDIILHELDKAARDMYLYKDGYVEEYRVAMDKWNNAYTISTRERLGINWKDILKRSGLRI